MARQRASSVPSDTLKVTPNLRGATFTEIIFFDHIKANYLNLHFPKKLT